MPMAPVKDKVAKRWPFRRRGKIGKPFWGFRSRPFDIPLACSYPCTIVIRRLKPWLCLLTLVASLTPKQSAQAGATILPLAEVKPGMTGEAYTVFQGTKPEPFKIRVVSVLRDFLPKQDIILVRAEDARVEALGIAAGMSGSPVYVDGKLMGAIAYGWSFAKEPLAGVTPIESMLALRTRPDRPPSDPMSPVTSASEPSEPTRPTLNLAAAPSLQRVAIPLAVAGASEASLAYLGDELRGFGLQPVRAGGGGNATATKSLAAAPVPGSAVGVALIQGDMTTTAMGTLTYAEGKQILAFGHSMFGIGSVSLPMVSGEIHAIIPSLASSLKMSSPVAEIGTVTDDAEAGVVGVLGSRAGSVPVRINVTSKGVRKPPFVVTIARHRRLFPVLATTAVTTAIGLALPDVTDALADVTTRIWVHGFDPIVLRDQIFTHETVLPRLLAMSHGIRALTELLGNPFAPAVVDTIEVDARVEFRGDHAEIVAVSAPSDRVHAGDRVPLQVTLRPYAGVETVETVSVDVPPSWAGRALKVEVAAGSLVRPETPRAENLRGFIENLRAYYAASSLVVSIATRDDGAALHGQLIRNLPPSALDTLKPAFESRRADSFRIVQRTEVRGSRPLLGKQDITLLVTEPRQSGQR